MTADTKGIEHLLNPESIAVIGATPDSWYSAGIIENLLGYGYTGDIYLVNPGRETEWGIEMHDSIGDIDTDIDLAVLTLPRELVPGVLRECGEKNVGAAVVITAGFSEADRKGETHESEIKEISDEYDIRVLGPNCLGLLNSTNNLVLTPTCSRAPVNREIDVISQSGALAFTTIYEWLLDEALGVNQVISTGNSADIDETSLLRYITENGEPGCVLLYLEGVENPREFMDISHRAIQNGYDIYALKTGASETGEQASLSHTAAITGDNDAWNAAFRQSGVTRVRDIADLIGCSKASVNTDSLDGDKVCIVTTSGGLGASVADTARSHGFEIPDLPSDVAEDISEIDDLLVFNEPSNPVDIRGAGAENLSDIASLIDEGGEFDCIVICVALSCVDDRAQVIAREMKELNSKTEAATVFLWTGRRTPGQGEPPFLEAMKEVPLYREPDRCISALAAQMNDADTGMGYVSKSDIQENTVSSEDLRVLGWREASSLLERYGVSTARSYVESDVESVVEGAESIGYPVALKIDSTEIPHRSGVDGVRVDIRGEKEVRMAYQDLISIQGVDGVVVQDHIESGFECILGLKQDELFGPVLSFGVGGTLTEVIDESGVLIPPLSRDECLSVIGESRLGSMMRDAGLDLDGFVDYALSLSEIAVNEDVFELDLNPVLVSETDVVPLDVLVVEQG